MSVRRDVHSLISGTIPLPDSTFYLGMELERAVNRTDFFRLFKALALAYDCQYFVLSEVLVRDGGINLQHVHSLHILPDSNLSQGITHRKLLSSDDHVIAQSKRLTTPFSIDLGQYPSVLTGFGRFEAIIGVPLHAASAKRYCLLMFGDAGLPSREKLALIALEASLVFQRYFEAVLSLDSITGLNDRETQIVRWTSEGKTSGEIAVILSLSEHTVNSYISLAMRKLDVVNRAQLVATALRRSLID